MTKCGVVSVRNRSRGSKRPAAHVVPAPTHASRRTSAAVSTRGMPLRLVDARALGSTGGTREDEAQDERGNAKQAGANEKERVPFEQRAAGRQMLDDHAREPFRKLSDVGVCGAEKRILRRRVAEARQA